MPFILDKIWQHLVIILSHFIIILYEKVHKNKSFYYLTVEKKSFLSLAFPTKKDYILKIKKKISRPPSKEEINNGK
jgi:hypothetical protein